MDAAPSRDVGGKWLDSARWLGVSILTVAGIAGLPASALAQGGEAGALARPWRASAVVASHAGAAAHTADSARAASASSSGAGALAPPDRAPRLRDDEVALDVAVATHIPISLGLEANLALPVGPIALLVRGHFGFMPEPYVGIINGVAQGLGAYDADVATLVSQSGGNAFVMRLSGGIRPAPGYGFEILAGYTMIAASTRVSVREFEQATGQSIPGLESIGVSATLHAFHLEMGWSALVWDHLVIRGSIGWVHTLGAEGRIDVPEEMRNRSRGRVDAIESDVRDALTTYGFSPEVRIGIGYRF
jgi:hypothetical protein